MKHTRKNKTKQPYQGSRVWDTWCRNHGQCAWCESNRRHKHLRRDDTDIEVEWDHYVAMQWTTIAGWEIDDT